VNKIELCVYNLVKNKPRLKRWIRDTYQRVGDLVPIKRVESACEIEIREGFFFGFHDKCPWSADNSMLLAHRVTIPLRMPKPDDTIEVGYFSGPNYKDFEAVGTTRAWNWHQGSMLQWIGTSSNIVFNDFDGSQHVARIVDPSGAFVATLPLPVAAVSPDGTKALSYSFARLRGCPHGYGYANGTDPEHDKLIPSKQGLYLVDIASGQTRFLFAAADIAGIQPEPWMSEAFNYFSHCQFSPSGKRFKFFHRCTDKGNRLWTRMISCDLDGKDIHVFPTSGMVSHVAWRDAEHVLAYARTKEFGDKYYLFRDRTDEFSVIGQDSFNSDGHPSFSKDGRWIITDTYPDRFRISYLILYDMEKKKRHNLAKLWSPRGFAGDNIADHLQCDLHPRWNRDSTMVCFDSVSTGERSLCTIALGDLNQIEELSSL
jgi:hypothetical protein